MRSWTFHWDFCMNDFWQKRQENGLSPVWIISWCIKLRRQFNVLLQNLHWKRLPLPVASYEGNCRRRSCGEQLSKFSLVSWWSNISPPLSAIGWWTWRSFLCPALEIISATVGGLWGFLDDDIATERFLSTLERVVFTTAFDGSTLRRDFCWTHWISREYWGILSTLCSTWFPWTICPSSWL